MVYSCWQNLLSFLIHVLPLTLCVLSCPLVAASRYCVAYNVLIVMQYPDVIWRRNHIHPTLQMTKTRILTVCIKPLENTMKVILCSIRFHLKLKFQLKISISIAQVGCTVIVIYVYVYHA